MQNEVSTAIGTVDVQVDTDEHLPASFGEQVIATLDRISHIHAEAQAYLRQEAPEDFARAAPLRAPSLHFYPADPAGTFTLFYSGADEDDVTCYGVDFRGFAPFDLTIGD